MRKAIAATAAAILWICQPVAATELSILATDADGRPIANAVVALNPDGAAPPPPSAPDRQVIDQKNETFIPLVVVLRRGGPVIFRNSDITHHHAYSFSPIKRFELVLEPGEVSQPVEFDIAGVAAIGCNIHDQMVAYVYVSDTPWTALTNADGKAVVTGIPEGSYTAASWHPRLRPGASQPTQHVMIGPGNAAVTVTVPVLPERPTPARHEHEY